jgi:hypothetical protein
VNDELVKKTMQGEAELYRKILCLILSGTLQRYFISFQDMEHNYKNYYLVSRKIPEVFAFKASSPI